VAGRLRRGANACQEPPQSNGEAGRAGGGNGSWIQGSGFHSSEYLFPKPGDSKQKHTILV